MSLITKIFGTYSQRQLKKLTATADRVDALAETYSAMSDEELRGMTPKFRERLAAGETLDDILPEAFAAIREADARVLGKRPFRVQILGGIVLHQGRIAEMKTGEGKTLVATLPAYLNALEGKGVHIVTVNDYLARVGAEEMSRVYAFMGMRTGLIFPGQHPLDKKFAYDADITYGTNNEFGFDYLRDNMVAYKKDMVQRGHDFAIVDEVDSILIDEARTPLIISGMGEESTDLYNRADKLVRKMKKKVVEELDSKENQDNDDADYIVYEKTNNAVLTARGTKKAEDFFGIENLNEPENATLSHHVQQAIKAHGCMHRDVDYVVNDRGVMIVDTFTGRLMPGRRYNDGLHQAIEAKEGVQVEKESKTLATITFQNYFRLYRKLSGMTGTALTEESEFREIYSLDVVEIPTNKPMIRVDHKDVVYATEDAKYKGIIEQIQACHQKGQPILVGTVSVEKSEELHRRLEKIGIQHKVLNAKHHEQEAQIVAHAGKRGAVTIATNMAGRGTDILLGGNPEIMAKEELRKLKVSDLAMAHCAGFTATDDAEILQVRRAYRDLVDRYKKEIEPEAEYVRSVGGLFILGTERHESRRIDNQLRGRAGRQGDPGESRFFISLQDDLMRLFGGDYFSSIAASFKITDDTPIDNKMLSGPIETAQKRQETKHFNQRKSVLAYDDIINQQRTIIYKQRSDVLNGEDISETVQKMITDSVSANVQTYLASDAREDWDLEGLRAHYLGLLTKEEDYHFDEEQLRHVKREDIEEELLDRALACYNAKKEQCGEEHFREAERAILLSSVDVAWMEHIDAMEDLKSTVGLQSYAQRDPITEYRIQSADMFDSMIEDIRQKTARGIFAAKIVASKPIVRRQVAKPIVADVGDRRYGKNNRHGQKTSVFKNESGEYVARASHRIERNEPCPCGSGKKYKNCCMRLKNGSNA